MSADEEVSANLIIMKGYVSISREVGKDSSQTFEFEFEFEFHLIFPCLSTGTTLPFQCVTGIS